MASTPAMGVDGGFDAVAVGIGSTEGLEFKTIGGVKLKGIFIQIAHATTLSLYHARIVRLLITPRRSIPWISKKGAACGRPFQVLRLSEKSNTDSAPV